MNFDDLTDFISHRMRMSHVYQPLMLIELLRGDGTAAIEEIARAFVAEDRSQIEYYAEIVKRMPGPVPRPPQARRAGRPSYRLVGSDDLTTDQAQTLIDLCRQRLDEYIAKRGDDIWNHRPAPPVTSRGHAATRS